MGKAVKTDIEYKEILEKSLMNVGSCKKKANHSMMR